MVDLTVGVNGTHLVKRGEREQVFEKVILGDGATINFDDDVDYWKFTAKHVEFGENVFINAGGSAGEWRNPGADGQGTRSPGHRGSVGGAGQTGGDGKNGVRLDWHLTIYKVGGVIVNTSGGNGGRGGDGGAGGRSGDARCSDRTPARDGATGGAAGDGGQGGNAGEVRVRFKYGIVEAEALSKLDPALIPGISFIAEGGIGGEPGKPGRGGEGGSGNRCGWAPNMPGGNRGARGASGRYGADGSPFAPDVQEEKLEASEAGGEEPTNGC